MKNLTFVAVCQFFGSQQKTAEILKVTPGIVNAVVMGRRPIPVRWAPVIEEASNGKFLCEELCPEVNWSVIARRHGKADPQGDEQKCVNTESQVR